MQRGRFRSACLERQQAGAHFLRNTRTQGEGREVGGRSRNAGSRPPATYSSVQCVDPGGDFSDRRAMKTKKRKRD